MLSPLARPVDTIEGAHAGIDQVLGPTAALLFALALLASGFAASGVGTLSGQVVMQGFIRRRIPLVVRRLVTLAPALVVIAAGVDPTRALVISQVVLSFGIPFALIPLVLLTRRRDVMGVLVNRRLTTLVAAAVATVIPRLNVMADRADRRRAEPRRRPGRRRLSRGPGSSSAPRSRRCAG